MNERALGVLEQYDFEVKEMKKGRGMYILQTNEGMKSVREFHGSEQKLLFEKQVLAVLKEKGAAIAYPIENKEGKLISSYKDDNRYIVRDWYEGKECNVKEEDQIQKAVAHLAWLHSVCRGIPFAEIEGIERYYENELLRMIRRNAEMKKVRNFMRKRKKKTEFELAYLKYYPYFFEKAREGQRAMDEETFLGMQKKAIDKKAVFHGEYNYHNIHYKENQIITEGFEHCKIGIQLTDLYDFMRKVLEKWEWDIPLGMKMLKTYHQVIPMSFEDISYMKWRLSYPDKFWKISNYYANKKKSWISERSLEKLNNLVAQEEKKQRFLQSLNKESISFFLET